MKLRDTFTKPIDRPINGVIKADQSDSESVWQELDEYVVTAELSQHFRKFYDGYLRSIDHPADPDAVDKVGVWISGFFGSGKSHFLKILSYLLVNAEHHRDSEKRSAVDFFDSKIEDSMLLGDIKRAAGNSTDVILFNIDSKADSSEGRSAILSVFLKVLNEKLGYSADHPHIAHLERYLDARGKLGDFKSAFADASGESWEAQRDAYHFHEEEIVGAIAKALGKSTESAQSWFDKSEDEFSLTVENFAKWVKEYLDTQPKGHRLLFLVDEIGQFIGQDTHLMLSLQTITENLGTVCKGQAWVVVTSQEDIDAVIGDVNQSKANDFSKIQARFRRLSLSSHNADEVIQKRLLMKTSSAQKELAQVYAKEADILKNQLSFTDVGMTFPSYENGDNFALVYPFKPYQFPLVQKIFEAIRRHGVTGLHLARGERSMLDAFQMAAKQLADEEIGVLVPLYQFYPAVESFLEGVVKSTIDGAATRARLDEFDVNILKTLFLIRYVDEMRASVDNLVTLFVDSIDADRLAIRGQIEQGLQRLENETLIARNGEYFFFLTNEEQDISRDIKKVELNPGDESKLAGDILYLDVLRDQNKHRYAKNQKDFSINRVCDLYPVKNQNEGGLIVSVITPLGDDYPRYDRSRCTLESSQNDGQVIIRLPDDETIGAEIRAYLQTDRYVRQKNDGTLPPTTERILKDRANENRERRSRIVGRLAEMMAEADFYAAGQSIEIKTSAPQSALDQAVDYLITNTFNKLGMIEHLSSNPQADIRAVLTASDVDDLGFSVEDGKGNQKAVDEVLSVIELMHSGHRQVVLHHLASERFARRPYGWPEWETALIIARLLRRGDLQLVVDGGNVTPREANETLQSMQRWRKALLTKRKSIDSATLQKARRYAKEIFGSTAPDGENAFDDFVVRSLNEWRRRLGEYKTLASTGDYPGGETIIRISKMVDRLLDVEDSVERVEILVGKQGDLVEMGEDLHELDHFHSSQRNTWDRLRKSFDYLQANRHWLERVDEARRGLDRMAEILQAESPYGLIREADGLIETVEEENQKLLSDRRKNALSRAEARIEQVTNELDRAEAGDDLRNECLHPLQSLKRSIEFTPSVAYLIAVPDTAAELTDKAMEAIEKFTLSQQASVSENPTTSRIPKVIRPASYASNSYIESKEQLEEYLKNLREAMESAIEDGERIEIR